MKKECVVLIYNSFNDPLFQNLVYQYIITLTKTTDWKFHLITFEQPEYPISDLRKRELKEQLLKQGIYWYPKKHRTGSLLLVKKVLDFFSISRLLVKLRTEGVQLLWAFTNISASIGFVYSTLLRMRLMIYSYEPHSQFMVELGLWKAASLKYKTLNYLEWKAGLKADVVLTGTKFMVRELKKRRAKGLICRAPTSVDENDFFPRKGARKEIERRHQIPIKNKIILYIGKFGGLYYSSEIAAMFKNIEEKIEDVSFIVITQTKLSEVKSYFKEANFPVSKVILQNFIPYEDIKIYMSGSDLGISAVPPSPSQKYRSPTKVAEYLLCGLPYLTCRGVSEDDIYAERYGVGIVVEDFDKISDKIDSIKEILNQRNGMKGLCRKIGIQYRGKSNVMKLLHQLFDEEFVQLGEKRN